ADGEELQHHVRYAQPALQLLHRLGSGGELEQHVRSLAVLIHSVSEAAFAPLIDLVYRRSGGGQLRSQLLDERVDLLFRRVGFYYEQLFVNPHASSVFKPGARRLNLVMAFSTTSAIMERTAAAA